MNAKLVLAGIVLIGCSGLPGLLLDRRSAAGERIAVVLMALGSLVGAVGASLSLADSEAAVLSLPWRVPGGQFSLRVDGLAAVFLMPAFVLPVLGSVYGLRYWRQADHATNGRKLRVFYGLMTAGIALLVVAKNMILFLAGWEVMALAAFLLVSTEDEKPAVRDAGLVYLIATRAGTLCLFAFFALLYSIGGSLDFAVLPGAAPPTTTALFVLALAGFGLKAGLMPLHVWLPGAHSNAPSHVSAVMSGLLIKTGIYGLVRFLSFFPNPPVWWGVVLVALGALSGILGVAFAIAQHDIKRLLAYHSVENIGIIVMGLGLAVLGRALTRPDLVVLGIASALLHVWNHGLFKALLFLSAGAVVHTTGTREIDRLGGLAKRMPVTSVFFLVGAVAICGLPPLNGFVSEYLLYVGLFRSALSDPQGGWLAGAFGAPALALIGALALACFVKAFGAIFLGEARTACARQAHEAPPVMLWPMGVLVAACAVIGLAPVLVAPVLDRAVSAWAPEAAAGRPLASVVPLVWISIAAAILTCLVLVTTVALCRLSRPRRPATAVTWDCGYAAPSATMQYTSSSFAQMLVGFFHWALWPRVKRPAIEGAFASPQVFHSDVPDTVLDRAVRPALSSIARLFSWFRWMQRGSLHAYLLYILAAVIAGLFLRR